MDFLGEAPLLGDLKESSVTARDDVVELTRKGVFSVGRKIVEESKHAFSSSRSRFRTTHPNCTWFRRSQEQRKAIRSTYLRRAVYSPFVFALSPKQFLCCSHHTSPTFAFVDTDRACRVRSGQWRHSSLAREESTKKNCFLRHVVIDLCCDNNCRCGDTNISFFFNNPLTFMRFPLPPQGYARGVLVHAWPRLSLGLMSFVPRDSFLTHHLSLL